MTTSAFADSSTLHSLVDIVFSIPRYKCMFSMYSSNKRGLFVSLNYTSVCINSVQFLWKEKKIRDRKKVVCDDCPTRAAAVPRLFCRGEKS